MCRIPDSVDYEVMVGALNACLAQAPQSDLDIMGLRREARSLAPDLAFVSDMGQVTRNACLFCGASSQENAFA